MKRTNNDIFRKIQRIPVLLRCTNICMDHTYAEWLLLNFPQKQHPTTQTGEPITVKDAKDTLMEF